jgi:hypothetical protein
MDEKLKETAANGVSLRWIAFTPNDGWILLVSRDASAERSGQALR